MQIRNYDDFLAALRSAGFSMGGGNAKGIFSLLAPFGEGKEPPESPIRWHTEDPETDPWEWRMRVLEEEKDIVYGKLFFKTSGYITLKWYPCFLAVRRGGESFQEAYEAGRMSHFAKRIYALLLQHGTLPLHEIKAMGGFSREDSAKFDRAMTELQMGMFITMCGRARKLNKYGAEYGWNSTVFCTVEQFWEAREMEIPEMEPEAAYEKIREQILKLNPEAEEKVIDKFIRGR